MKQKTAMILLVALMTASVFTGCGKNAEGADKVQAAMGDAISGTDETETVEPATEPITEPTIKNASEATEESTAEPVLAEANMKEPEPASEPETPTGDVSAESDKKTFKENGYTFTDMDEVMYIKTKVNVRTLPSTDGQKIGSLTGGTEIRVTGECVENGWYRIEIDGGHVGYVSGKYVVEDKSMVATASTGSAGTSTQTGSSVGEAQDVAESGLMSGFIDYLNQQRAAAGLSTVSWDNNLAAEAQRRANAVVSNFSHDGKGNYAENLYKGGTNTASDVYSAWYNSDIHKAAMMHVNLKSGGCAFVKVGIYYYVVFVGVNEAPVMSAEEWNKYKEEAVASGELTKYETNAGTAYMSAGGGVLTEDDPMYDEVSSWDWGAP